MNTTSGAYNLSFTNQLSYTFSAFIPPKPKKLHSPGIFISPVQKVFSLATKLLPNTATLPFLNFECLKKSVEAKFMKSLYKQR